MASDWADEKAKRLLDDAWGWPAAGDVVGGVAQALRDARAEVTVYSGCSCCKCSCAECVNCGHDEKKPNASR